MLVVFGFLLFTEICRDILTLHAGRQSILDDPNNWVFLIISLLLQIGVSMIAYGAAKLLISKYDKPVA